MLRSSFDWDTDFATTKTGSQHKLLYMLAWNDVKWCHVYIVMYILHLALKTRISWLCDNFSVGSLYENSIKWQHNTVILQRMLTKLLWSIMLRPILCKFYLPHVSYLNSYEIKLQYATLVNNTIFFITYKCDRILECQQFSSKQHNFFAYNHVSYQKRKSVIISQILCCLC